MSTLERAWRAYILPAAVFQSLMIGGGYGTGQEIVQYFTRFGLLGGLCGLALVVAVFALVLGLSYDFARCFRVYDYRAFFHRLIGRAWVLFELLYLSMFALVLAVITSASSSLIHDYLHFPAYLGTSLLLLLMVLCTFYGRTWVTRILALKAFLLCGVFATYLVLEFQAAGPRITAELANAEMISGWAMGALRYSLYASVIIPAMLFATRGVRTRQEAFSSGAVCALAGMIPGAALHLSFGAAYPQVLDQQVPVFWMISGMQRSWLTMAYLIVLVASLFDVGIGFIQSVNERIDGWLLERSGRNMSGLARATVSLLCVLVGSALSLVGIVPLIAKGYATMAWGFLILFVGPLLTVGVYRLFFVRLNDKVWDISAVSDNLSRRRARRRK